MSAITQFEVYVRQHGRWSLHARYPADKRDEALNDARSTDFNVRLPTKVIRETYFPELNNSERVTIYTSAKAQDPVQTRVTTVRRTRPVQSPRMARRRAPKVRPSDVLLRLVVTVCVSLFFATVITGFIGWILQRSSLAAALEPAMSNVLPYCYAAIFLLFSLLLLRSRLPLRRLLADMWRKSSDLPASVSSSSATRQRAKRQPETAPRTETDFSKLTPAPLPPPLEVPKLPPEPEFESGASGQIEIAAANENTSLIGMNEAEAVLSIPETPFHVQMAPALIDVLMLTELRPPNDPASHDVVVRNALATHGGMELKHTKSGIFARFHRADAAVAAALEIQQRLGDTAAIALIGNSDIDNAPHQPALLARATSVVIKAKSGAIVSESAVHAEAALSGVKGEALAEGILSLSRIPEQIAAAVVEPHDDFASLVRDTTAAMAVDQLNPFSRFGFGLYLAGAASVAGQVKHLARDAQIALLRDALQSAGNSPERAEAFCADLPSYGKNQKFADMVEAGAQAMSRRFAGQIDAPGSVAALLGQWSLPGKRPSLPSAITFLFTDVVGSMEMTQQLGNATAQKAVRTHNAAVRIGVEAHNGQEVKHLGDGIMAVFPDPPSAVLAAIQMQHVIASHNAANPNLQIRLRIGINVGEAIVEDNDFFGVAVQMTARICNTAATDNIWVSKAVVEACSGFDLEFIQRGRFVMKGVLEAKTLYEVAWADTHKEEIAELERARSLKQ